jgi:hypothetical protein
MVTRGPPHPASDLSASGHADNPYRFSTFPSLYSVSHRQAKCPSALPTVTLKPIKQSLGFSSELSIDVIEALEQFKAPGHGWIPPESIENNEI